MKEHKKNEDPYIYLFMYAKLVETYNPIYVKTSAIKKTLRSVVRVPCFMLDPMMFQMEELGLIQRINKQKYRILRKKDKIDKLLKLRSSAFW